METLKSYQLCVIATIWEGGGVTIKISSTQGVESQPFALQQGCTLDTSIAYIWYSIAAQSEQAWVHGMTYDLVLTVCAGC
jgi:hypothetical protein